MLKGRKSIFFGLGIDKRYIKSIIAQAGGENVKLYIMDGEKYVDFNEPITKTTLTRVQTNITLENVKQWLKEKKILFK